MEDMMNALFCGTTTASDDCNNNNDTRDLEEIKELDNSKEQQQEQEQQIILQKEQHLDWSSKQSRILTCNGQATLYYTKERGFSYHNNELPHTYLQNGKSREIFEEWAKKEEEEENKNKELPPIVGAWTRPLFVGAGEHSTGEHDETVFNLQTRTLFIDLRIPKSRSAVIPKRRQSLKELPDEELRLYARQHIFCGYTRRSMVTTDDNKTKNQRLVCTRHHCIDWNYVGVPRPRPNKWYVEPIESPGNDIWKEWAFAKDEYGQHYYMERWERLEGGNGTPRLALRRCGDRDGIVVVVGDHFNYILDRQLSGKEITHGATSLVELVDAAIQDENRDLAEKFLTMEGGHGRVSNKGGWCIDTSIKPWSEGTQFWKGGPPKVEGTNVTTDCHVVDENGKWKVLESSFKTMDQIRTFVNLGQEANK